MSLFSDTGEVSLKLCRLCPASQPTKKGSLLAPFLRVANASHEASRTCAVMVSQFFPCQVSPILKRCLEGARICQDGCSCPVCPMLLISPCLTMQLQEQFLSCQHSNPTAAWETISNFEKITREHGQTNWLVFPRVLVTKHWHILTTCNCSKSIPAQGWRLPN